VERTLPVYVLRALVAPQGQDLGNSLLVRLPLRQARRMSMAKPLAVSYDDGIRHGAYEFEATALALLYPVIKAHDDGRAFVVFHTALAKGRTVPFATGSGFQKGPLSSTMLW